MYLMPMPEDSKKTRNKPKHEPKDQRKPRRQSQPPAGEKKAERHAEHRNKVPEEPGPEFYKGLKRETDEILKITEEASKFKKKEIQSNWAKYEMPIESYDEIDEADNLGADYEKLIQTPMSIGGHFQFKHEKSWDISTEPSMYDKYFEINMESLATALLTIPFNDRNNIDLADFSETDRLSMENRSIKYKRKYFGDKLFMTAEIKSQDTIASMKKSEENIDSSSNKEIVLDLQNNVEPLEKLTKDLTNNSKTNFETSISSSIDDDHNTVRKEDQVKGNDQNLDDIDDILAANVTKIDAGNTSIPSKLEVPISKGPDHDDTAAGSKSKEAASAKFPDVKSSKPIIENPDDLEKWLDDFLDG